MKQVYARVLQAVARLMPFDRLRRWAGASTWRLWLVSLLAIHDFDRMRAVGWPWWTFAAARRVDEHLASTPGARVAEWGSGTSTLWLAERAAEVFAVEHDLEWARQVAQVVPAHVQVLPRPSRPVGPGQPAIRSAKPGFAGQDFAHYVEALEDVPGAFDLIVVDGRAREACLPVALVRLAPGGLIVFDNVDRQRYRDAIAAAGPGLVVETTRGLTPSLPYPTRTALIRRASTS